MKTVKDYVQYFNENKNKMMNMVKYTAIYVEHGREGKERCAALEKTLRILADGGNAYAAALYCAVVVNDNHEDCFSKEVAFHYLIDEEIEREYRAVIYELFEDVVDREEYEYFCLAPECLFADVFLECYERENAENAEKADGTLDGSDVD